MKVLYFFGLFLASVFLFHDAYAQNGRGREKKKARKEMADGKVTSRTQTVVPAVSKKQIKAEREALTALYHATDGDNWKTNTNWRLKNGQVFIGLLMGRWCFDWIGKG